MQGREMSEPLMRECKNAGSRGGVSLMRECKTVGLRGGVSLMRERKNVGPRDECPSYAGVQDCGAERRSLSHAGV